MCVLMFWKSDNSSTIMILPLWMNIQLCQYNQITSRILWSVHFLSLYLECDLPWSWRRRDQWVQVCHLLPSEAATLVWNNKGVSLSPYFYLLTISSWLSPVISLVTAIPPFDIILKSIIHHNTGFHHQQSIEWRLWCMVDFHPCSFEA